MEKSTDWIADRLYVLEAIKSQNETIRRQNEIIEKMEDSISNLTRTLDLVTYKMTLIGSATGLVVTISVTILLKFLGV